MQNQFFKFSAHKISVHAIPLAIMLLFSFCAQAAEEFPEQEEQVLAEEEPVRKLHIRHRVWELPAQIVTRGDSSPAIYPHGQDGLHKYIRQADGTYKHFSFCAHTKRHELTEPTAYRYEIVFDQDANTVSGEFVSVEKGKAEPTIFNGLFLIMKPCYCVQILPQTYSDEFHTYEKKADGTYKRFSWSQKNKKWEEDKGYKAFCKRYCWPDGRLITTQLCTTKCVEENEEEEKN